MSVRPRARRRYLAALGLPIVVVFAACAGGTHSTASPAPTSATPTTAARTAKLDPDVKATIDRDLAEPGAKDEACVRLRTDGMEVAKQDFLSSAVNGDSPMAHADGAELDMAWSHVLDVLDCDGDTTAATSSPAGDVRSLVVTPSLKAALDSQLGNPGVKDGVCAEIKDQGEEGADADFHEGFAKTVDAGTLTDAQVEVGWLYFHSQLPC